MSLFNVICHVKTHKRCTLNRSHCLSLSYSLSLARGYVKNSENYLLSFSEGEKEKKIRRWWWAVVLKGLCIGSWKWKIRANRLRVVTEWINQIIININKIIKDTMKIIVTFCLLFALVSAGNNKKYISEAKNHCD